MAAIANFRQLCCLGLAPQAVMPSLLSAAHELIPSETNAFFWADQHGKLAGFLPEHIIPGVVTTLIENFEGLVERSLPLDFAATMFTGRTVGNLLPIFTDRFYRGDVYNLIYRPYNLHHAIDGVVRESPGAVGLGAFVVGRSQKQPEFSFEEKEILDRLLPYIAHALRGPEARPQGGEMQETYADSGESGLVILDPDGHILHSTDKARHALYLATHPSLKRTNSERDAQEQGLNLLSSVCRRLQLIFQRKESAPPVIHHTNPWGRFVFRAYWLEPSRAGTPLMGVMVQHQEPIPLVMMRKMHAAGLSAKQKEVALLLQQELPFSQIASRLHISHATAKDYADRIYRKLNVHNREEMLQKLT